MIRSLAGAGLGLALLGFPFLAGCNTSSPAPFRAEEVLNSGVVTLSGANEVPPITTTATGSFTASLNVTQRSLTITGSFSGLTGDLFPIGTFGPAHVHEGAAGTNGPVAFSLLVTPDATGRNGTFSLVAQDLTQEQIEEFREGLYYVNIHTTTFNSGELRGQITFPAP
ncbi:MAG: CHRD domain-containing protein [Thermostichales cyanobacterium BF4_bins_65]